MNNCKILVHIGDGTAFLESLAINKPTICFLENLNWIRNDVRKDYEELIDKRIIFNKYEQLSSHINEVYNKTEEWWCDKEVEWARTKFCEKYSKPAPKKGLNEISKLIKEIVDGKYN